MVELKILRLEHNKVLPEYKTEGASGMDLSAAITEAITLAPLERRLVPTGIKIELPLGYEAQIRARSGLSIKHGITLINAVGTVDSDYRGEVCVPLVNLSNETYTILPDERIAQMVICKVEQAKIVVQELLSPRHGIFFNELKFLDRMRLGFTNQFIVIAACHVISPRSHPQVSNP